MNTTTFKNDKSSSKRVIALFVLLLLSTVRTFSQPAVNEIAAPAVINPIEVAVANSNTDSQLELVSWFMGSKQSQLSNSVKGSNNTSTNMSGKKQFINNGMTPNRILSRTFLKKAINHDSTIA